MSTGYIYRITNTTTGDFYVGKTERNLPRRFKEHCYAAKYGSQTHLHRAIRKYGVASFVIEAIESHVTIESLSDKEMMWIEKLIPQYNMTKGGEGIDSHYWQNVYWQSRGMVKPLPQSPKSRKKLTVKCHPEVSRYIGGWCKKCWLEQHPEKRTSSLSKCHPERKMYARGKCRKCWYREKMRVRQGTSPSAGTHHTMTVSRVG